MYSKILKAVSAVAVVGLVVYLVTSCKMVSTAEKEKAKPAATAEIDTTSLIKEVKDTYVCPRINMTITEAEDEGALCPEGKKMLDYAQKMASGGMEKADIIYIVKNHANQGRSLVADTGARSCSESGKLKLDFYIMSYCPYGVRYVLGTLQPMIKDMGAALDYEPYYIMQKTGDKLEAMHGQKEVDENLRQICVRDKWSRAKWDEYVDCFSNEVFMKQNSPEAKDWKFCANKVGIKPEELSKCASTEGPSLAEKDLKMSMQNGASGSPTAIFNCNKQIVGAIPYEQVKPKLCKMISGKAPAACI